MKEVFSSHNVTVQARKVIAGWKLTIEAFLPTHMRMI